MGERLPRPGSVRLQRILLSLAPLALLVPHPARSQQTVRREFTELHMGMAVRVVLHAPDDATARDGARAAFAKIAALEDIFSDHRPSSELRRLAATSGHPVEVGADLCAVLATALEIARNSAGAFDPTIAPLVALWRESRRTGRLPSSDALAAARRRVGWSRLRLDRASCVATLVPGTELDLGGIAKGYVIEQALDVLRRRGLSSAMIEAGGDIVVGDPPPGARGWRISVPHADPALAERAASLANAAISTSGDAEQFVEIGGRRYSHVVDPRTGLGSTTRGLATVIAERGTIADALATALAVVGAEEAAALLERYPRTIGVVRRDPAPESPPVTPP